MGQVTLVNSTSNPNVNGSTNGFVQTFGPVSSAILNNNGTALITFELGRFIIPGFSIIKGIDYPKIKLDIARRLFASGAKITPKGREPTKFTIDTICSRQQDKDLMQQILVAMQLSPFGNDIHAFDIIHPQINMAGIKRVFIELLKQPGWTVGPMTYVWHMLEDTQPKETKPGDTQQSVANFKGKQENTPNALTDKGNNVRNGKTPDGFVI